MKNYAVIVLVIGIGAVSTASIFIRYAQAQAPSLVIAAYRLTLASAMLIPYAWLRRRDELRRLHAVDWRLAILSGVCLALHFATWISSLEYTSVASSVVMVTTSPLWVAVAGWLLLRERLTRPVSIGLSLAVAGGVIIGMGSAHAGGGRAPLLGNALALVGAWAVTGYWLIGRRLRSKLSLVPYVAVVYGTAAIVLLMMVAAARQPLTGYAPLAYVWFLLLALIPQLIGHSSFNWALARLPAVFVAVATLGEPIGSAVLACLLLGEVPSRLELFGAALILTGIGLTLKSRQ